MKLYLVRHGQTDFNIRDISQGRVNTELNETGRAQARELAQKLKGKKFDAYYVSPLSRARDTARIITDGKADFIVDDLLIERSFGDFDGKVVNLGEKVGDLYDLKANISTGGIEPFSDVLSRTKQFLDKIKSSHAPDAEILIVAHGALLKAMHFNLVGYDENTDFYDPASKFQNCELREYEI